MDAFLIKRACTENAVVVLEKERVQLLVKFELLSWRLQLFILLRRPLKRGLCVNLSPNLGEINFLGNFRIAIWSNREGWWGCMRAPYKGIFCILRIG